MERRLTLQRSIVRALLLVFVALSQAQQLPAFDPAPTIKDGQGVFTLPLVVQSEMLGLAVEVVLGVKILLSEAMSIAPEALYYINANVVDDSTSLYFLEYEVVTPMEELEALKGTAKDFVSSGGLATGFANLGIPSMQFVLGSPNQGTTATIPSSANPTPPPAPREPDTEDTIAVLLDVEPGLLPEEEASRMMHLYIISPVLFFHPDLKLAITWFAGDRTGTLTEPPSWYMTDVTVLSTTLGQYIASFVHIGPINATEKAVSMMEQLVDVGELDEFLIDNEARNVTISLLPVLNNIKPEPRPSVQVGYSTVVLLVRVSAPITGVISTVSDKIKESGAVVTNTKPEDWSVKQVVNEVDGAPNGPFWVDYEVVILDTRETLLKTVANMTMFIRTKVLEQEFWEMGFTDIRILPRKRLTRFESSGGGGAIQSSAATAAASIGGMVIVIVVAGLIMCLLPRDDEVAVEQRRRVLRGRRGERQD